MFNPNGNDGRGGGPIGGLLQTLMSRFMRRGNGGGGIFGGMQFGNRPPHPNGMGGGAPYGPPDTGRIHNIEEQGPSVPADQWFNRRPGPQQNEDL